MQFWVLQEVLPHIVAEQVSLAREGDALWGDGEQALRSHHRTQM